MHFPVFVISKPDSDEAAILDLLRPYDENLGCEAYITVKYPEVKEYISGLYESQTGLYSPSLRTALECDDIETIRKLNDTYCFYDEIDEQGNGLTTWNPRGKWDYYGYGGRWSAILNGEIWCRLKDFPRIRNNDTEETLKEKFPALYEKWEKHEKTPVSGSRAFFQFLKTRYCYVLVTPSGEWIEPGRYAWWLGTSAGAEKDIDWIEEFNRILDSYPGDFSVTLFDCHI